MTQRIRTTIHQQLRKHPHPPVVGVGLQGARKNHPQGKKRRCPGHCRQWESLGCKDLPRLSDRKLTCFMERMSEALTKSLYNQRMFPLRSLAVARVFLPKSRSDFAAAIRSSAMKGHRVRQFRSEITRHCCCPCLIFLLSQYLAIT